MNVVVVLRALRDPAGFTVNRKAQKIFYNRDLYRLNPADANALEAGLALADAGHSLAAVAYGGGPAQDVLYQARALGAHRALWVHDDRLDAPPAGRSPADGAVVVRLVMRALDHLGGADLVLLGSEVLDADLAQVGPRLAAALDLPFVEAAWQVALDGRAITAVVKTAQGYRRYGADLPAVVSLAAGSNRPRYAPAAAIIRVYAEIDGVTAVTPADLDLDDAALEPLVVRRGESFPPERTPGRRLEGDITGQVRALAKLLTGE